MNVTLEAHEVRTIKLALVTEMHELCQNGFHHSETSAREVYNHFAELTDSETLSDRCVAIRRLTDTGEGE